MDGPERLLTARETVLEDKRNSHGGANEAVNNRNNRAGGTGEAVNSRSNSTGGAEWLLTTGATVLEVPGRLFTT